DSSVTELNLRRNSFTELVDNMFSNFTSLTHVYLTSNQISQVSPVAFTGCPIAVIAIDFNRLTAFPDFNAISGSLRTLTISHNPLTHIKDQDVENLLLTHLYAFGIHFNLSYGLFHNLKNTISDTHMAYLNDITDELSSVFEHYTVLESLRLDKNEISTFPDVSPLSKTLRSLDLNYNNISSIPSNIFANFTSLAELTMKENPLREIPNLGAAANNLETLLHLDGNSISVLPSDIFDGYISLTTLTLSRNLLTDYVKTDSGLDIIPTDIPVGVTSVNLQKNQLTSLGSNSFSAYGDLSELNLGKNDITWISPEAFEGCPITYLNVYGNQLTSIPDFSAIELHNREALVYLDLESNILNYIDKDAFNETSLVFLNLKSNMLTELRGWTGIGETLQKLIIAHNQLTWIARAFRGTSIANLFLSRNSLSQMPDLCAINQTLELIHLNRNLLSFISSQEVECLSLLKTFSIENCQIT
ncbi:hypothetical protein CAPTEDRAFT_22080, partial [Capitella teleta]